MKALKFKQCTKILAEHQPQYEPLPVYEDLTIPGTPNTACFALSDQELEEINRTGVLWITQFTNGNLYAPLNMSTQDPFAIRLTDGTLLNPMYPKIYLEIVTLMDAQGYALHNDGSLRKEVLGQPDILMFSVIDKFATVAEFQGWNILRGL